MSELECHACAGVYHHHISCSNKFIPLPVYPVHTATEVGQLLANQRTTLLSQLREEVEGLRLERGQEIIEAEKHTAPEILWNEIMADDAEINAYNKVLALIEEAEKGVLGE